MSRSPPGTWRLLSAASVGWAVTAWSVTSPGAGRWVAVGAGLLGLLIYLRWRRAWSLIAIACAVLLILGARIEWGEWQRAEPSLAAAAERGRSLELEATVDGFPEAQDAGAGEGVQGAGTGGQNGRGASTSWVRASLSVDRGAVPVLLWFSTPPDERLVPGVELLLTGTVASLEPSSSAAFGISVDSFSTSDPGPVGRSVATLRVGLRDAASQVPGAELVPGFAVGDTSLIGEELQGRMTDSSLTHLVAVSGANCALVTSALIGISALLGAGRRTRIVLASAALGGFVLIVGPDSSVQRAAVMAAVVLVSNYGGKRAVALPSLAAAMLLLLFVDPWQALQPGFALSVAATAGILLLVPSIQALMNSLVHVPRWLTVPVAVAIAAQLACGPLLLLLQPDLPAVGVLANVLAGPAAPLGTGLGLLALILLPILPALGTLFVQLAAWPARWVAATAEICSELPLSRWNWPGDWNGAALLALVQGLGLLAWLLTTGRLQLPSGAQASTRSPWGAFAPSPMSVRVVAAVALSGALGLFFSVTIVAPMTAKVGIPRGWVIVACDVGQGDALLVKNPHQPRDVILVDTGDAPDMLRDCLERFSVKRISLLVLTHDHRDHIGALEELEGWVDRAIIAPPNLEDQALSPERAVEQRLIRLGIPFEVGYSGSSSDSGSETVWEVLAPARGAVPPDSNAGSLIMRFTMGTVSILMLGDSGRDEHAALVDGAADLDVDILKVAHHGSRDADASVIESADAEVGLISVGADNTYGHPAPDLLDLLQMAGTEALRTDELGSIAISGAPGALSVWSERDPRDVRRDK